MTRVVGRSLTRPLAWAFLTVSAILASSCNLDEKASNATASSPQTSPQDSLDPGDASQATIELPQVVHGSYIWRVMPAGAGGFVTGIVASSGPQAQIYARTDVGGAFRWDPATEQWTQLLTATSLPDAVPGDARSVDSIAVAPSQGTRVYLALGNDGNPSPDAAMSVSGRILVSDDGGSTWRTSAQRWFISGNQHYRVGSERLAVNPTNPDHVLFGSSREGLFQSFDAGTTWAQVPTSIIAPGVIGDANSDQPGVSTVAFVGSAIFAGVAGVGMFTSGDGGTSWRLVLEFEATQYGAGAVDVADDMWVAINRTDGETARVAIFDLDSETWTTLPIPSTSPFAAFAVDPADTTRVVLADEAVHDDHIWSSTDGGQNWSTHDIEIASPQIPWLANTDLDEYMSTGRLMFDPAGGTLWFAEGMALWRATDLGDTITFTSAARGIEETVASGIIAPPGGVPIGAVADRQGFRFDDTSRYPDRTLIDETFVGGTSLDYSGGFPETIAWVGAEYHIYYTDGRRARGAVSRDGGVTWQQFGNTTPDMFGGEIAVSAVDPNVLVWLPTHYTDPWAFSRSPVGLYYSHDGGQSWSHIEAVAGIDSFHRFMWWFNRRALAADRVNGNFYLLSDEQRFFTSTDGAVSWQEAPNAPPCHVGNACQVFGQLYAQPDRAERLWAGVGGDGLYRSDDAGRTPWIKLSGVEVVNAMGFGAPVVAGGPLAVFVYGRVNGDSQMGIYRSDDDGNSWVLISSFPADSYTDITAIAGDPAIAGRVYVAFGGTGFARGDPIGGNGMKPLRCALIGADTLLLECGQMLLDRGHTVVSVAAGSARVADWAAVAGIPAHAVDDLDAWAEQLRAHAVDHLFAITHLHLLPANVLASVNGLAINFHDGPLPEIAGLNTPMWGLLRDEAEWGVTWHRIDAGVDTGAVLVQRRFAVAQRETSLSLNTRNFEMALDTFGEVLDLLERGHVDVMTHDTNVATTTFRRSDRPTGILDFTQSAAEVDRLVRALHFGPHPNPVGAAVVWSPTTALVAGTSAIADLPDAAPGTVLAASDDCITIACASGAVQLGDLRRPDGRSYGPLEFLHAAATNVGAILPRLSDEQHDWFAHFAMSSQRIEASIVAALGSLSAATFPWPQRADSSVVGRLAVSVPTEHTIAPEHIVAALAILLSRWSPDGGCHVALAAPPAPEFAQPLICSEVPLDLSIDLFSDCGDISTAIRQVLDTHHDGNWLRDVVARTPSLAGTSLGEGLGLPIGIRLSRGDAPLASAVIVLQPAPEGGWEVEFDGGVVRLADANKFANCLTILADVCRTGGTTAAEVALLSDATRDRVVHAWNATDQPFEEKCVHDSIAEQISLNPMGEAVICGDETLTYAQLGERSERLALRLQALGAGSDSLVGVQVARGLDLVVAVLAVLRAGAAYVPLDPSYPAERLRHMIDDSGARLIVCQEKDRASLPLPHDGVDRIAVPVEAGADAAADATRIRSTVGPNNLAYCIYTSGSAGAPKGVLVEHRNVANLFAAMDAVVERGADDTWCAVTSLSFDISVLELLYTLARGIRIALYVPAEHQTRQRRKPMDFSLFYFSADESESCSDDGGGKYALLLDGARFADANGFCAVWTPERHFHAFGGLYPNPAVTAAAIATITERISIRAGSVVLPLHHPVEVAESWSMVDNLSKGRAGVSFASGWQPNDFVLRPQNYARAKAAMFEGIDQFRRLWRGEEVAFDGPSGAPVTVTTLPRPVQPELPMWITTAGSRDSFVAAGEAGTNLLTHLVGQSIEQLASKIAAYRTARASAGHDPATGIVTLMLHTFVGDDEAAVRATVREPLRRYLSTSYELLREHAWTFPTFRRPDGSRLGTADDLGDLEMANLDGADLDAVLDFAADRYYESSGLFGTPQQVLPLVDRLHQLGVDEIACLVDFGIANDAVLAALPHLARVRDAVTTTADATEQSLPELLVSSRATHVQCTPSMARMLTHDPAARSALAAVRQMFVGGEALPTDLAHELQSLIGGTVCNMYGPTETTVWSSTWPLRAGFGWTPIGSPIANTQMYVLDNVGQPTPPGVLGHLWIGGAGVARGYHQRPDLTADRFRPDPFRGSGRMYRTGDLARWRSQPDASAVLEFLGRADQQVKLRGHRIELGEIEAELRRIGGVADCAVVVSDNEQLIGYVVSAEATLDERTTREALRARLPEAMVPNKLVAVAALPRTPNGKLDRRALPNETAPIAAKPPVPASNETETHVLSDWQLVLGASAIGIDDNFFDVGGHSLLMVRLHRRLQETLGRSIALTDLYRFPTVRTFAASLAGNDERSVAVVEARSRAARRRASSRSGS